MKPIALHVNGRMNSVVVEPDMPLLWCLRETLGLTGTKYGCGLGLCGACTVHVEGVARRSCCVTVSEVENKTIITIEGLLSDADHPLQRAWLAEHASQCGYCQPGQIMAAAALLRKKPDPTEAEIDAAMSGNLCRCGIYQRIRRAIQRAAKERPYAG